MKKQASSINGQDVQLRALEREAKAQRDLLESYLAKYREANTRENIEGAPTDGRIISRATVSNMPAYPKKLPIVLIATLATLLLTSGAIVTGELLRMTAPRASGTATPSSAPMRTASPPTAPYYETHEDLEPARSQPQTAMAAGIDRANGSGDRRTGAAGRSAGPGRGGRPQGHDPRHRIERRASR